VKPWKTVVAGREKSFQGGLQFGHGGEAVEDGGEGGAAAVLIVASIRPRR